MSLPINEAKARLQERQEQYDAAQLQLINFFSTKPSGQSSQTGTQQNQTPSADAIIKSLRNSFDAWMKCYEEVTAQRQVQEQPYKEPSIKPTDSEASKEISKKKQPERQAEQSLEVGEIKNFQTIDFLPELEEKKMYLTQEKTEKGTSTLSITAAPGDTIIVAPPTADKSAVVLDENHPADTVNEHSEDNPCPDVTDEQAKLGRPSVMAYDHTQAGRCTYVYPEKNLPNDAPMPCSEDNNIPALTIHVEHIRCSELLAVTADGTSGPAVTKDNKRLTIHKPRLNFPHQNNGIPWSDTITGLKPTISDDCKCAMLLNKPTLKKAHI